MIPIPASKVLISSYNYVELDGTFKESIMEGHNDSQAIQEQDAEEGGEVEVADAMEDENQE